MPLNRCSNTSPCDSSWRPLTKKKQLKAVKKNFMTGFSAYWRQKAQVFFASRFPKQRRNQRHVSFFSCLQEAFGIMTTCFFFRLVLVKALLNLASWKICRISCRISPLGWLSHPQNRYLRSVLTHFAASSNGQFSPSLQPLRLHLQRSKASQKGWCGPISPSKNQGQWCILETQNISCNLFYVEIIAQQQ